MSEISLALGIFPSDCVEDSGDKARVSPERNAELQEGIDEPQSYASEEAADVDCDNGKVTVYICYS